MISFDVRTVFALKAKCLTITDNDELDDIIQLRWILFNMTLVSLTSIGVGAFWNALKNHAFASLNLTI